MKLYPARALDAGAVNRYFKKTLGLTPVRPPQRLPSAAETAVWRLTAQAGAYVAKIFPADQRAEVRAEVDLCDFLRGRAVRTPDPLAGGGERIGRFGPGWRGLLGARALPILLMTFDDGREVDATSVTRAEMLSIAWHIGLMHKALQQYPRRAEIRPTERWGPHLGRFEDFLLSPNARSFAPRELARLQELDRRMQQRALAAASAATAAESVLHGDLGLRHVRLEGPGGAPGEMPFLFDFSDFSRGPVVVDLATMLSQLYCRVEVDLGRWERLRDWLLEGYGAAFPLSLDDHRALEDALVERLLIEARYFNRVALARRRPFHPGGVRKRYRLAAHLLDHGRRAFTAAVPQRVGRTPERFAAGRDARAGASGGRDPVRP